jgi:hypothetical protein
MKNIEKIKKLEIYSSVLVYQIDNLFFYAKKINENKAIITLTDNVDSDKDQQCEIDINNIDEISKKIGIDGIDVTISKLYTMYKEYKDSMIYPKNYNLIKMKTLEDAKHPQPDKYPDGYIKEGFMWEYTMPIVGNAFHVFQSKTYYNFRTSVITEIVETTEKHIIFKTENSIYKIIFN